MTALGGLVLLSDSLRSRELHGKDSYNPLLSAETLAMKSSGLDSIESLLTGTRIRDSKLEYSTYDWSHILFTTGT